MLCYVVLSSTAIINHTKSPKVILLGYLNFFAIWENILSTVFLDKVYPEYLESSYFSKKKSWSLSNYQNLI